MKFFCEYCGARIDAQRDDKCPHCGASFNNNKTYKKLEEQKNREEESNAQIKQEIVKHTLSAFKFSRIFFFVPIVIFVVVLTIIIVAFVNISKDSTDDIFNKDNDHEVTVNLNEFGSTSEYKAKVTKYEQTENFMKTTEEGYEYIKFYLIVENTSGKQIKSEDVNCLVDGIAQDNDFSSGYSTLPFFISKGLTVQGTATFKVPTSATSYDIKYGDNIVIHIEK